MGPASHLRSYLQKVHAHFGYASPSTVADVVFLEAVKRRGGDVYIVLPVPLDVHLETCAKKFAEIEELTGEKTGPFGSDYRAMYAHVPVVAATCKRLLEADLPVGASRFTPEGVLRVRFFWSYVLPCSHASWARFTSVIHAAAGIQSVRLALGSFVAER